ncbi:hypothetical protein BU17DRAFT_72455 [Hysterangium stoloniferum]|nr:hypothetical protein BU17DRAFT_72455 [Hysterangium stoloniferum]
MWKWSRRGGWKSYDDENGDEEDKLRVKTRSKYEGDSKGKLKLKVKRRRGREDRTTYKFYMTPTLLWLIETANVTPRPAQKLWCRASLVDVVRKGNIIGGAAGLSRERRDSRAVIKSWEEVV